MRLKPYAENTKVNGEIVKVNFDAFEGIYCIWKDYWKDKEKTVIKTHIIEIENNQIILSDKYYET
jgi:hypothetical protein